MPVVALAPGLTLTLSSPSCSSWSAYEILRCFLTMVDALVWHAVPELPDKVNTLPRGKEELVMDSDRAAGMWKQIEGKVKQQWGKLTDDDLQQLEGHSEQLAGKLQERYGLAKEEAERQAKEFRQRNNWN